MFLLFSPSRVGDSLLLCQRFHKRYQQFTVKMAIMPILSSNQEFINVYDLSESRHLSSLWSDEWWISEKCNDKIRSKQYWVDYFSDKMTNNWVGARFYVTPLLASIVDQQWERWIMNVWMAGLPYSWLWVLSAKSAWRRHSSYSRCKAVCCSPWWASWRSALKASCDVLRGSETCSSPRSAAIRLTLMKKVQMRRKMFWEL